MYYKIWKPVLDITVSISLLVILSPLILLLYILIYFVLGRPVLFTQTRVGKRGERFKIIKFRTMVHNAELLGGGYSKSELIPPLGRFLRASSLDELPQLLNIARGEMSFIGPRPTLPSQVERYSPEQKLRHRIKPGLTGRAQIKYRNNAPWSLRIIEDNIYIDNLSFRNDLKILLSTIKKVFEFRSVAFDQSPEDIDDLAHSWNDDR